MHILVHAILTSVLIVGESRYWSILFIVVVSHYLIDLFRLYLQTAKTKRIFFGVDQLLHIAVILIVSLDFSQLWNTSITNANVNKVLLLIIALLMITIVSSKVIKIMISKWSPENEDTDDDSLSNAGSYIGMLERLFVFGFVVTGNIQAVGFLLAAKSVFRFGDLKDSKDRKLTEYILIGTLLSFGVAILIALAYLKTKSNI